MRDWAIGGVIGANLAALVAGFAGHMDRAVGWMAVSALYLIAAAVRGRR